MMAGVDIVHVPYRGGGPALVDLLGGQVQMMFGIIASSMEYIRAGKLRPLAVSTAMRVDTLPDVPTVGDFLPGYEASDWYGICAPKGTPVEIVDRLNAQINAGSRRSQAEGAARRPGRHSAARVARRVRQAHRR